MKLKFAIGIAASALLCAFLARPLLSDDEGSDSGKGGGAANGAEALEPGPEHKELAKLVGKWEVIGKFWMGTPDDGKAGPPGTSEFKSILGGRYIQQDFTGTFMGKPYTGMGVMGYDRYAKHYTAYWNDSVSTMPMFNFGAGFGPGFGSCHGGRGGPGVPGVPGGMMNGWRGGPRWTPPTGSRSNG